MNRGAFVVLEGIDGAGTTTQAELLANRVRALGRTCLLTREPTSLPVGKLLRQALTHQLKDDRGAVTFDWAAMALLFAADRVDHVRREIDPVLKGGGVVICDRYDLSSLIYQSETSPRPRDSLEWLRGLNAEATRPDLTLVLVIDADVAARRRAERGGAVELFERAELQRRLAVRYREAEQLLPQDRIHLIEAAQPREALSLQIWAQVQAALPQLGAPEGADSPG